MMLKKDKQFLRWIMKNAPEKWSDERAASECECSVSTARKYRKVFTKPMQERS